MKKQKPVPPLADIIVAITELRNRDDAQKCIQYVWRSREISDVEKFIHFCGIELRLYRIETDRRLMLIERALGIRSAKRSRIPPRSRKAPRRLTKH
jgi:hypothetical protein